MTHSSAPGTVGAARSESLFFDSFLKFADAGELGVQAVHEEG